MFRARGLEPIGTSIFEKKKMIGSGLARSAVVGSRLRAQLDKFRLVSAGTPGGCRNAGAPTGVDSGNRYIEEN